jgi:hypothetical protein
MSAGSAGILPAWCAAKARSDFQLNVSKGFVRASRSLQARCLRSQHVKFK